MAEAGLSGADRPCPRRWSFAGAVFDEASWSLTVGGERVAIEKKPLELLRELLVRGGAVASKDELLDLIWPDVTVVEASLPTAIYKLRSALRDHGRRPAIVETVPGVGYRLAAEVAVEASPWGGPGSNGGASPANGSARGGRRSVRPLLPLAAAAILLLAASAGWMLWRPPRDPAPRYTQRDAANALRRLDVAALEAMLSAGWDPNAPFDREGNGAVNYVLNTCEWDPGHDRRQLLLVVRTLFDGGARFDRRNVWGDTAYSIAKADRYCGPDHPVTRMIHTLCYAGHQPPGDRCLASYELRRRGQPQGAPDRALRARAP